MKMFKNIMLVTALFAMSFVSAKQVGGAKIQQKVIPSTSQKQELSAQEQGLTIQQRQEMLNKQKAEYRAVQEKMVQEQAGQNVQSQASEFVSQEAWDDIEDELDGYVDAGKFKTAGDRIKQIERMNLTRQQKTALRRIKQTIILLAVKEKPKTKQPLKRWFSKWWSGEAGNVDMYKNMVMKKLRKDIEKYPSLNSKKEAVRLGLEFFNAQYNDQSIMKKASKVAQALVQEVVISGQDELKQEQINTLIGKMRKHFKVDLAVLASLSIEEKIDYLKAYLNKNKTGIKDFVVANITNDNFKVLSQAILSETARINAMITSLESLKPTPEKQAEERPVTVPQGRPAGNPVVNENK